MTAVSQWYSDDAAGLVHRLPQTAVRREISESCPLVPTTQTRQKSAGSVWPRQLLPSSSAPSIAHRSGNAAVHEQQPHWQQDMVPHTSNHLTRNILVIGERLGGKTSTLRSIFNEAYTSSENHITQKRCQIKRFYWHPAASKVPHCPQLQSMLTDDHRAESYFITTCELDLISSAELSDQLYRLQQPKMSGETRQATEMKAAIDEVRKVTNGQVNLVLFAFKRGRFTIDKFGIVSAAIQKFGKKIEEISVLVITYCDYDSSNEILKHVENELFRNNQLRQMFQNRVFPMCGQPSLPAIHNDEAVHMLDGITYIEQPPPVQYHKDSVEPLQCVIMRKFDRKIKLKSPPSERRPTPQILPAVLVHQQSGKTMRVSAPAATCTFIEQILPYSVPIYSDRHHFRVCIWATYSYFKYHTSCLARFSDGLHRSDEICPMQPSTSLMGGRSLH